MSAKTQQNLIPISDLLICKLAGIGNHTAGASSKQAVNSHCPHVDNETTKLATTESEGTGVMGWKFQPLAQLVSCVTETYRPIVKQVRLYQ